MSRWPDPLERFMFHVEPELNSGCWLWAGTISGHKGYGRIQVDGRQYKAHRFSWIAHRGPLPAGLCVLHRCDTPVCVNRAHLFLGTNADNMADMSAKGRGAWGERSARAKLSASDVAAIRSQPARTVCSLGREFGVSHQQISKIRRGQHWLCGPMRAKARAIRRVTLTDAEVSELRASGLSLRQMVQRYGISKLAASRIRSGFSRAGVS